MKIVKLLTQDIKIIQSWEYTNEYSIFNYALKENGWFNISNFDDNLYYKVIKDRDIIGLFLFIPTKSNEFRILINPSFLHQGYGKKITFEAIKIGFDTLEFDLISLIVRKEHQIAIQMYTKLGFEIVGEIEEYIDNKNIKFFKMINKKGYK